MISSSEKKPLISITESPSNFDNLEKMSVHELLASINSEDAKVHIAVREAIPQIEALVNKIVKRMLKGG
ncbi:MAG: N-acetylmuramic acid 6-phosphate etherase, partial [Bacteroidetes bacterium]|nr:N-acetylmuramic acid 6-phosphate etherase [Bacteroidota bacterium]